MSSAGRIHPCIDKAQLRHILERQVETNVNSETSLETQIDIYEQGRCSDTGRGANGY